jgi:PAS domain S-box-containing protein
MAKAKTKQQLTIENEELLARLQELEDTLEAIRSGAVDAIVTSGPAGDRVYTLEGADHAYHTMVESMNEGAVTVLTDGTILYANRQFGQMTGASPSGIVGRPFHDFVQPSDHPIWNGFIRQAGADGLKAEVRLGNQSAAEIPVQISATPIDLGGAKALALVVADLTESRRYQEIVAAERLSRYILEQSLEGVAVCIHGRILFASRRLHEIYGGNTLMQPFDKLFPLRISESEVFSVEILQSGQVLKSAEVSYQNPDGVSYSLILNAGPLYGDEHRILGCLVSLTDITERKRAEEDLQRNEARFRLLSGTAGRLLSTDDPQGLVKELCRDVMEHLDCQAFFNFMVDERAGRLRLNACAGIPEEEVLKLEWLDFGVAVCGCVARDGARIVAEDIFHTPDARTELVKSYGIQAYCCHPLKAGDRLIGTLSFGTKTRTNFNAEEVELMRIVADQVAVAMQRIQSQREIVESSQRLQLALDAGGMGMWAWDLQTNRMMWNTKEYELMGLPAGDGVVDAEEFFRYVHPEDAPELREALGEVIAHGSLFVREFRIARADGQIRWLASVGRVMRTESGQPLSIIGINYDATERKKILEVLRESEERFRGVFEQSFSGIVLCDFKGRILEVNPTFCRMLGYMERELVGRKILDLTHPEDREIERANVMELKEGRLNGFRLEKRFLGQGGRVIWAEIGVSALHDDEGNVGYALGMVEDITERKAAEEALRRSKDELEEKVNERTAELMLLLEDLEKGRNDLRKLASELVMTEERERKRIAVTLHDEVAQTLAAAKMRLDLLKKVTDGQASSEVVDEARDLLMQSIRETRALMTDISSPILYEMGLPAAVQNLAEQTSASYGLTVSHDVTGEFSTLGQELTIMIYQAVRELLKNVSKHSEARNVSVRVIAENTGVRTIVADDGRGFEVGDVGLPRHEGGFGLFSIRERVKSFHGSMQIESAPGKGTVVTVALPSSLGKAEQIRDEDKVSPKARRKGKHEIKGPDCR